MPVADVHVLEFPPLVNDSAVAMLEDALERAKKGEIRAIALAIEWHDLSTGCAWPKGGSYTGLVAAASSLQYRLTKRMVGDD